MWTFLRSLFGQSQPRVRAPKRHLLRSADTPEKRAVTAKTLLELRSGKQLIHFGDHYRYAFSAFHHDHGKIDPEDARHLAQQTFQAHPELAPAYLFHPSGHVRQAAIEALAPEHLTAFTVTILAARTNDWVEPVRKRALTRLLDLLPQAEPYVLETALPVLIRRSPSWRRYRVVHGVVVSQAESDLLDQIMTEEAVRKAAIDMLLSVTSGPTTRIFRGLARFDWLDPHLETLSRQARANGIRRAATAALLQGEIYWKQAPTATDKRLPGRRRPTIEHRPLTVAPDLPRVFVAAARDRTAAIRALAADMLIRLGPDAFPTEVWGPLKTDKRISVRTRMDFFRRKWIDDELPDYLKGGD
ncbi:hypothetical protein [uncultured Maricaulis sp.]|uniref:hypothetical protein n=1 Tax=uncultured Maricaulis sp. TaxID=174710 RepID=UPI00263955FC|nr:hypothetical protein [uncultured Maricaulis sp.]